MTLPADIRFANPEYFWLLLIIPLLITWYIFRQKRLKPDFRVPGMEPFSAIGPTLKQRLRHILFILKLLAFGLLVGALARPQTSSSRQKVETEGIDIVMAIDVSSSMLAEDFRPNRIEAAKKHALDFIDARINDRIGIVVFAGESFTQSPITIDHDVLKNLMQDVKSGIIEDGTAIGEGLATSVSRLKESKAKSKIIILLTDGKNNKGSIAPATAAEIAKTFSVRVYTIGVGSYGTAPYPFQTPFGTQYRNVEVEIDEEILKEIAETTGGKYFRATNNTALEKIYGEIDQLEKTKIDVSVFSRYSEEFWYFALAAGILFALELLLRFTIFRTFP
jgi:Ca-activated chloride channel family protein